MLVCRKPWSHWSLTLPLELVDIMVAAGAWEPTTTHKLDAAMK